MLQRNKGSILIVTLLIFTIVNMICVTSFALILSNNRIFELDQKNEILKEANIGIIEIINSNILNEVKNAINNTSNEEEFYKYFTINNSKDFINRINNISNSDFSSGIVSIAFDNTNSSKEYIAYNILSRYEIENYDKYAKINFRIKNPWHNIGVNSEERKGNIEEDTVEITNDENYVYNIDEEVEINESDLVIFYNYEEN